jgi:hypothetical protein
LYSPDAPPSSRRFLSYPIFETLLGTRGFEKSYKQIFIISYTNNTAVDMRKQAATLALVVEQTFKRNIF